VASSYSPARAGFSAVCAALERAGYGVLVDPELSTTRRYQRAEDERRAASFTRMWLDPRVKAVISGTGGYGAVRMLPYLILSCSREPQGVRRLLDITVLHLWLMRVAGCGHFAANSGRLMRARATVVHVGTNVGRCHPHQP